MAELKDIFRKYLDGTCTPEELNLLLKHFDVAPHSHALDELIQQELQKQEDLDTATPELDRMVERNRVVLNRRIRGNQGRLRVLVRYAAVAASILVLLSIGLTVYLYSTRSDKDDTQLISRYGDDVLPGGNRAILTLADGSHIDLDSAANGLLADQQGIRITKDEDGTITYEIASDGAGAATVAYNTISTPNGGQYKVVLPDGSTVWLNAASALTYPTQFTGNERQVTFSGEGYFEIARNERQPFILQSPRQTIQVLGTAFNLSAYDNEPIVTTTLVNGSISIAGAQFAQEKTLKPGQQSELSGQNIRINEVDVRDYTSWKDGLIILNDTDLAMIIRQLERWYDVEFDLGSIPTETKLNGILHRNAKLSAILEVLELNTQASFTIAGRRIMVRD